VNNYVQNLKQQQSTTQQCIFVSEKLHFSKLFSHTYLHAQLIKAQQGNVALVTLPGL
jgi:hypothetical protein